MLGRRLHVGIKNTYFPAELRIWFTSGPVLVLETKDKLPMFSTSCSVCHFTRSFGAHYVDRTKRGLFENKKEHHPTSLNKEAIKYRQTAITIHLMESDDLTAPVKLSPPPPYIVRGGLATNVKSQIPPTAEANAIHLNNLRLWNNR